MTDDASGSRVLLYIFGFFPLESIRTVIDVASGRIHPLRDRMYGLSY